MLHPIQPSRTRAIPPLRRNPGPSRPAVNLAATAMPPHDAGRSLSQTQAATRAPQGTSLAQGVAGRHADAIARRLPRPALAVRRERRYVSRRDDSGGCDAAASLGRRPRPTPTGPRVRSGRAVRGRAGRCPPSERADPSRSRPSLQRLARGSRRPDRPSRHGRAAERGGRGRSDLPHRGMGVLADRGPGSLREPGPGLPRPAPIGSRPPVRREPGRLK